MVLSIKLGFRRLGFRVEGPVVFGLRVSGLRGQLFHVNGIPATTLLWALLPAGVGVKVGGG